tara:strand:+ start:1488 stop:1763 length:276 start_codon:yes stop_codon:yes gene_type:complete
VEEIVLQGIFALLRKLFFGFSDEKEIQCVYPLISTGEENDGLPKAEKNEEVGWIEKNPWNMVARSKSTLGKKNNEFPILRSKNHVPMEIKG